MLKSNPLEPPTRPLAWAVGREMSLSLLHTPQLQKVITRMLSLILTTQLAAPLALLSRPLHTCAQATGPHLLQPLQAALSAASRLLTALPQALTLPPTGYSARGPAPLLPTHRTHHHSTASAPQAAPLGALPAALQRLADALKTIPARALGTVSSGSPLLPVTVRPSPALKATQAAASTRLPTHPLSSTRLLSSRLPPPPPNRHMPRLHPQGFGAPLSSPKAPWSTHVTQGGWEGFSHPNLRWRCPGTLAQLTGRQSLSSSAHDTAPAPVRHLYWPSQGTAPLGPAGVAHAPAWEMDCLAENQAARKVSLFEAAAPLIRAYERYLDGCKGYGLPSAVCSWKQFAAEHRLPPRASRFGRDAAKRAACLLG